MQGRTLGSRRSPSEEPDQLPKGNHSHFEPRRIGSHRKRLLSNHQEPLCEFVPADTSSVDSSIPGGSSASGDDVELPESWLSETSTRYFQKDRPAFRQVRP